MPTVPPSALVLDESFWRYLVHAVVGMYRRYQVSVPEWVWSEVGLEKGKGKGKGNGKGKGKDSITRAEYDEWNRDVARRMRARPHVESSDSD